ncbi:MAG: excinuclease ABC subunit UvrB [Candidatus Omnitrophota bacterium]
MKKFTLTTNLKPGGDQPQAIKKLREGYEKGQNFQTLLGVTGSGKTFTIANFLDGMSRPVLVISHNKTLAAQLYSEFKDFFPHNAVEYFVSYYDYYQPEAYIPQTDTYIEKDASINEQLDRLRLSTTSSLISRQDTIVVASVSCIYNLGSPEEYQQLLLNAQRGQKIKRNDLARRLVDILYERNDVSFTRGTFRIRGDVVDIFPSYSEQALRIEFFGEAIENIYKINPVTLKKIEELDKVVLYPAKHFLIDKNRVETALKSIEWELEDRLKDLNSKNKLLEAQRLESRTRYDMEMLKTVGYCHGIENYSRHLSSRPDSSRPYCLLDYFPEEFITVIDESHVTIPQIRGMYAGDKARKEVLVEHGFRLPSCLDNRPLKFDEFKKVLKETIFVSATPADYELRLSGKPIEQIVRPTGLLDPEIEIRPTENQIDDIIEQVQERANKEERVLITTLTKKMAEDLTAYLKEIGLKVRYLHSEIDTLERVAILKSLRKKEFDCLVGINLLREGIDLPEVSLVCMLDADKAGFLRSYTSLIQITGRCARNVNAKVIMYADKITEAMAMTIKETERRRKIQVEYNKKHNIKPATIKKAIREGIEMHLDSKKLLLKFSGQSEDEYELNNLISHLQREMEIAAKKMEFEKAAELRDRIKELSRHK